MEQMYANWKVDKESVHASWDAYFTNLDNGIDPNLAYYPPSNLGAGGVGAPNVVVINQGSAPAQSRDNSSGQQQERLTRLFMKYRDLGHEIADINPLEAVKDRKTVDDNFMHLDDSADYHDFAPDELNKPFDYFSNIPGIHNNKSTWSPREIADTMSQIYCGPIAFEYMHIGNTKRKQWIRKQIENVPVINMTKQEKIYLLDRV